MKQETTRTAIDRISKYPADFYMTKDAVIELLERIESNYWQKGTPTEDGLYVIKFKRWNLDCDFGYMCMSIKDGNICDEITGDQLSEIYAVKWHKIQPSEESSVTDKEEA